MPTLTEIGSSESPAEPFVSVEQQRHAATFGMWIFLATEVLFFGGLLVIYTAYRGWYPAEFAQGSRHLDFVLGTTNTAVLLFSSFFMAGAVSAGQWRDRRSTITLLFLTAFCGLAFLGIKGTEWHAVIEEGFFPGRHAHGQGVDLFYSLYFALTGLHAIHLLIGITIVLAMAVNFSSREEFAPRPNVLRVIGLYWHFVDVVWIFLYPLLYFIGRSS